MSILLRKFMKKIFPRALPRERFYWENGLFCSEESVARIAETGNYVCVLIELFIERGGIDIYIGMSRLNSRYALCNLSS